MRKKRKAQEQHPPAPPMLVSLALTYDAASDVIQSLSVSPQEIDPLVLLRAVQRVETQLFIALLTATRAP